MSTLSIMPLKRKHPVEVDPSARGLRYKAKEPDRNIKNLKAPRSKCGKTSSSSNAKPIFRFFDLPREIRDQAYDEIWRTKKSFITRYHAFQFYVEYEITADPYSLTPPQPGGASTPPWLVANKQLTQEAIEQFQRKATWVYLERENMEWIRLHFVPKARALISLWEGYTLHLPNV